MSRVQCPFRRCHFGCLSESAHRAKYACMRVKYEPTPYLPTLERYEEKKRSDKINYDALKALGIYVEDAKTKALSKLK